MIENEGFALFEQVRFLSRKKLLFSHYTGSLFKWTLQAQGLNSSRMFHHPLKQRVLYFHFGFQGKAMRSTVDKLYKTLSSPAPQKSLMKVSKTNFMLMGVAGHFLTLMNGTKVPCLYWAWHNHFESHEKSVCMRNTSPDSKVLCPETQF